MKISKSIDFASFVLRQSCLSFINNKGLDTAAVLAYNSFFALFPLVLLLLYVAGRYMAASQVTMEAVERVVSQFMPMFSEVIMREVEGLSIQKAWGGISLLLLLWGVTPLAGAIRGAFDRIYKRDRPLPFMKEKLLDGGAVLLMLVMLCLLVVGEIVYAVVSSSWLVEKIPRVLRLSDFLVPALVTVFFLSIIHYVFAPVRLRFFAVLTGGILTALLLGLMGPLFTAIMKFNPDYGYAFGSLKAVFLLLIWIYYSFVAILLGVEVAACIHWREAIMVRELFVSPGKRHKYAERLRRYHQGLEENHVVFREGDPGDSMFYVMTGAVRLMRGEQVLRVMREGEYFGEMAMLLKTNRSATAIVSEPDTQLVLISAANMEAMLRQNPGVLFSLLQEMAQRLKSTNALLPPSS